MKILNLAVNYKIKYEDTFTEDEVIKAKAELTKSYIDYAVSAQYKDGLTSQFRRVYAKISEKIANALEDKTFVVNLEVSEVKFIREAFLDDKTKFPATISEYVVTLEDAILGL